MGTSVYSARAVIGSSVTSTCHWIVQLDNNSAVNERKHILTPGMTGIRGASIRLDRAETRPYKRPCGGRTWWAHFEFTRMNITATILPKKIEDLRKALAWNVESTASDAPLRQCRSPLSASASERRSWLLTLSTTSYHSSFTVSGYLAPRSAPAMDATESLSPPIFVARRMAASAEDMTVPSAMANGTIVSGPLGKYLAATSVGRSSLHWCRSWWMV